MDPYTWQRKSSILWQDHVYCRPLLSEPIHYLCVDPKIKLSCDSSDSNSQPTEDIEEFQWIDIENDDANELHDTENVILSNRKMFALIKNPPMIYLQSSARMHYNELLSNQKQTWNLPVASLYKYLSMVLRRTTLELSVYQNKFSEDKINDRTFRKRNHYNVTLRRISRLIRNAFGKINWRLDVCVELHQMLLESLEDNSLLIYMEAYALLHNRAKLNVILNRINKDILNRDTVTRISYIDFHEILIHNKSDCGQPLTPLQRRYNQSNPSSILNQSALIPVSILPPFTVVGGYSSTALRPLISEEPIFVCVTHPSDPKSQRITRILNNFSQFARINLESAEEMSCVNLRSRTRWICRRIISLMNESRRAPIYIVGFGWGCPLALVSILRLTSAVTSEGVSCFDNQPSSRPWLAGFICLGMPFLGLDKVGVSANALLPVTSRCAGLFIVGERSTLGGYAVAKAFRERLIAYRRGYSQKHHPTSGVSRTNGGKSGAHPSEPKDVDIQLLLVGGADHLLRLHPQHTRRWSITQELVDNAFAIAVRNFLLTNRRINSNTSESTGSCQKSSVLHKSACHSYLVSSSQSSKPNTLVTNRPTGMKRPFDSMQSTSHLHSQLSRMETVSRSSSESLAGSFTPSHSLSQGVYHDQHKRKMSTPLSAHMESYRRDTSSLLKSELGSSSRSIIHPKIHGEGQHGIELRYPSHNFTTKLYDPSNDTAQFYMYTHSSPISTSDSTIRFQANKSFSQISPSLVPLAKQTKSQLRNLYSMTGSYEKNSNDDFELP